MPMMDTIVILAVDDIEMNLRIMGDVLGELGGVEFLEARNGREALDKLGKRLDVDIVLLDLEMPVMNGYETLRFLKESDRFRDVPVIVVTSSRFEVKETLKLGANDFMVKPFDPEELKLRVVNHVRSKKLGDLARDMNTLLEKEIVRKTAALQRALAFSREAEFEISLRLGRAAEYRDLETGLHIRRISEMSKKLAALSGLSDEECEIIRHASTLHDVGKIGIPDRILLKTGKLEPGEFELMKMHSVIGGKILDDCGKFPVISAGRLIALQHHEKWDGSGYPHGLAGTDIHMYGRIVMVADVFDALTSERPYKKAFSFAKAFAIMAADRGVFFDPQLLDLFMENRQHFIDIKEKFAEQGSPLVSGEAGEKPLFVESPSS